MLFRERITRLGPLGPLARGTPAEGLIEPEVDGPSAESRIRQAAAIFLVF